MTTLVIDIADEDANTNIDLSTAYAAGVRGVITRAVYGRPYGTSSPCYIDKTWSQMKARILAAGMKRSAYLFLCYPNKGETTPDPEVQVEAFTNYVGHDLYADPNNQNMVPSYDVEETSNLLSAAEMYDWTLRCAKALYAFYGVWPMQYTADHIWQENLGGLPAGELIDTPQWTAKPWPWAERTQAQYGILPNQPTTIPQFENAWIIFQRQGDALNCAGFNGTVDISVPNVVQKGATGGTVKWIQKRVGVTAGGDFGPNTENAVKAFQTSRGLTADGIVGLNTFTPMMWVKI